MNKKRAAIFAEVLKKSLENVGIVVVDGSYTHHRGNHNDVHARQYGYFEDKALIVAASAESCSLTHAVRISVGGQLNVNGFADRILFPPSGGNWGPVGNAGEFYADFGILPCSDNANLKKSDIRSAIMPGINWLQYFTENPRLASQFSVKFLQSANLIDYRSEEYCEAAHQYGSEIAADNVLSATILSKFPREIFNKEQLGTIKASLKLAKAKR